MLEHSDTLQFVQEIQHEQLIVRQVKTKKEKEKHALYHLPLDTIIGTLTPAFPRTKLLEALFYTPISPRG